MTRTAFCAALLALSALALAGCADTRSGYPSLAPRPVERAVLQADAAPATTAPAVPVVAPASADAAQLLASARAADSAFRAALEAARPKVEAGRNAAEGSEAWVVGQQAYSGVDATRAPVGEALAELDRRRQAAVAAGQGAEEAALAEVVIEIEALDEAERAALAALMPA